MTTPALLCVAVAALGASVGVRSMRARHSALDIGEFLPSSLVHDEFQRKLADPLTVRIAHGVGDSIADLVERFVPSRYLGTVDSQLGKAGLAGRWRAGEQLSLQVALAGAGLLAALALPAGSESLRLMMLVLLPGAGLMVPSVYLKRKVQSRSDAIFKDLPDIVDMLAIAVEAGSGFEAALSLVCANFDSPFTDELAVALREMELGLPRRDALQQLRDRIDLEVVRTLVLALLQADGLGIPIGRILKSQATEVRARRRAWAREKAAKLPVKIMFPLVLFIFPPILVLVIGPAALSFGKLA